MKNIDSFSKNLQQTFKLLIQAIIRTNFQKISKQEFHQRQFLNKKQKFSRFFKILLKQKLLQPFRFLSESNSSNEFSILEAKKYSKKLSIFELKRNQPAVKFVSRQMHKCVSIIFMKPISRLKFQFFERNQKPSSSSNFYAKKVPTNFNNFSKKINSYEISSFFMPKNA